MNDVMIHCDWLQFSVLLEEEDPEIFCPDGFRVEILQGNNIYRNRAIVFDMQGRKWMTLMWSPFSSVLNKRLATVQLANELLYMSAIHEAMRVLYQVVPCKFNSCGRVDICADFQSTQELLEAIKHLNSGHYYVQGKSEGNGWWHERKRKTKDKSFFHMEHHDLNWGSVKSDIKVKLYHKSRELGMLDTDSEPEKPWIVSLWKDAGWDVTSIWRLEFSMRGTGQLRWDNKTIGIDEVASIDWLTHIFYQLYTKRFVVRLNSGLRYGHKNEDPVISFLNLPKEENTLRWAESERPPVVVTEPVKLLRKLMSQLRSPASMANEVVCEALSNAIYRVVEQNRLEGYFKTKFGDGCYEYLQKVLDEAGSGCYEVDGRPEKTWM